MSIEDSGETPVPAAPESAAAPAEPPAPEGIATGPISADAPTGQWVRYEPEFDELKQELDKIADLRADEVDWPKVVNLSTEILEKKSKDLLVASWLCMGLLTRKGFGGLAQGLATVHKLSESYWDTLFPETKRMRARISAIDWLNERASKATEPRNASFSDKAALASCISVVEGLDTLLREKLAGDAPSLSDLKRALKSKHDSIKVAAAAPAQAAQSTPAAPAAAPQAAAAPAAVAAPALAPGEDPDKALGKIWGLFRDLAPAIREGKPQDPTPYRLARMGAWMPMQQLPPNTDGVTRMQPMGASGSLIEQYDGLVASSDWSALLQQAEAQFEKSVLWLDAQRYVAMALEGLGHKDALQAVKSECAMLVGRFPAIANLKFSNDTPFASDETKSWLRSSLGGEGGGESGAPAVYIPPGEEDDDIDRLVDEARALVKGKKAVEAAAVLRDAVDSAVSRRQRFRRRLALAQFLSEIKQFRLATAQLECLDEEIERFNLAEWDPTVASQVLSLLVTCQQQLLKGEWKGVPEAERLAEKTLSRLARIDTSAALSLSK